VGKGHELLERAAVTIVRVVLSSRTACERITHRRTSATTQYMPESRRKLAFWKSNATVSRMEQQRYEWDANDTLL